METRIITREDAAEICSWKYEGEYSVYNYSSFEVCQERGWDIADDDKRSRSYVAVYDNGELYGFFNIMEGKDCVELGVGTKPEMCGKHRGMEFMSLAVKTVKERHPGKKIILKVRPFNKRAIKCYESCGFTITGQYYEDTFLVPGEMLIMEL